MKNIELIVKQELFDNVGVIVGQIYWSIDKKNDFRLCGSVNLNENKLEGYTLDLCTNMCDEKGNILFISRSYSGIKLDIIPYDSFSITCNELSRFFDIDKLHHIELYPHVRKDCDE